MTRLAKAFLPACGLAALSAVFTISCSQNTSDPGPTLVERGTADSVTIWPPALRYARTGDTLNVRVLGVKHNVTCATRLTDPGWYLETGDTLNIDIFRFIPPLHERPVTNSCAPDPGIDTIFRRGFLIGAGRTLHLQAASGHTTDTVVFVNGQGFLHLFNHVRATSADTMTTIAGGRFTFLDSTAGRPRRMVRTDSLGACEIFQAAVFTRRHDTLSVRLFRIQAAVQPDSILPACAGPRPDSVEVVPGLYTFP